MPGKLEMPRDAVVVDAISVVVSAGGVDVFNNF